MLNRAVKSVKKKVKLYHKYGGGDPRYKEAFSVSEIWWR